MGHEFEGHNEVELGATPEQVWEAIATGPGIDSWFTGRNQVEPGEGGTVRTAFGRYNPESTVTAWEPPRRFAYRTGPAEDGRFIAYEFLIEGRGGGSTVLRLVTSGFIPGDDWEAEYDAMTKGGAMFLRTLVEYLTHFPGRTATPVTAFGPPVNDWEHAWAALNRALGLPGKATEGDQVRCAPEGLEPIDGVVYFVNPDTLGVRTSDALYRFLRGLGGPMVVAHNLFSDVDQQRTERAWQSFLARLFAWCRSRQRLPGRRRTPMAVTLRKRTTPRGVDRENVCRGGTRARLKRFTAPGP
jgi:uncharacterized protein YndB with AHSA1/START domain